MRKAILAGLLVVSAGLLAGAAWAATVDVDLPEGTGHYAVGRGFGETGAQGARRIAYTLYYPAAEGTGHRGEYLPPAIQQQVAERDLGAFRYLPDAWGRIHGAARDDAAWAPGRFPLVMFSPGADVQPQYYSSLLVEAASHGYVVAALSHPGFTPFIAYSDGSVTTGEDPPLPGSAEAAAKQQDDRVATVAADILSGKAALLSDRDLAPHLDGRAVAFGHSLGGAAAIKAAIADPALLAVGDMDGSLAPSTANVPLGRPVFLFTDDGAVAPRDQAIRSDFVRGGEPGLKVTLHGASHMTFATDTNFFEEARPFGDSDSLGAKEALRDVSKPLGEFLAHALP